MVWGLIARGAAMTAARLAPKVATKLPRVIPAITRAVAKLAAPAVAPLKKVVAKVAAKAPPLAPIMAKARARFVAPAVARTLPVATRAPTKLKAAVTELGVGLVKKPFRTVLPYAATAGMIGAVSRIGEEKTEAVARRGGLAGEALTIPAMLPAGLGVGVMPRTVGEVPIPEPVVVRSWSTGTTEFAVDSTGQHWVLTKSGWKKYSPKKPIVLGTKHLTPKKFVAAAKKYYAMKKDLDKVFKTVRRKK